MLTAEQLAEWLRLTPDQTGLVWVKANGPRARVGEIAGRSTAGRSRILVCGKRYGTAKLIKLAKIGLLDTSKQLAEGWVESPQIVDQATLHKAVSYDPDTGEFSCLAPTGPRSVVGERIDALDDKGYRRVRLFGKKFFAHRLAWLYVTGNWPVDQIDHINLDKGDNRFSNLREANAYQNGYNSSAKNAQGLPKGVVPLPNGKFYAHCRHEGKDHYLGTHDSVPAAKQARDSFAREFHGDFFRE